MAEEQPKPAFSVPKKEAAGPGLFPRDMDRGLRRLLRELELGPIRTQTRTVPKQQRPRCGAHRRDGGLCLAPSVSARGKRCRMHGGLSTGPRTEPGKAAIASSNRRRAESLHSRYTAAVPVPVD
jgi:hypothetical protein